MSGIGDMWSEDWKRLHVFDSQPQLKQQQQKEGIRIHQSPVTLTYSAITASLFKRSVTSESRVAQVGLKEDTSETLPSISSSSISMLMDCFSA
eukprot:Gb_14482 [translate_table: standard]